MHPATLPPQATLLALAHEALADHLDRDEPAHALGQLLAGLARASGRRATLEADTVAGAVHAADGRLLLPLRLLGHALGTLVLEPGGDLVPQASALALACVTRSLAALRLRERTARASAGGGHASLLRSALRGAGTFVWEWQIPSDRLGDIDEGFEQLGYGPAGTGQRTQQDWDSLIHPEDRAANHRAYLRHAQGETDLYEHAYRALAADGQWHWLQERGRIVEWTADGQPLRMVGTQADITERRRAEAAADLAMQRLGKIAEHVPGALFQFRRDDAGGACFPYISERCTALFGLRPEEVAEDATPMVRRVNPAERGAVMSSIQRSATSGRPWQCEFGVRRRDGATRRLRGTASPQREADGSLLWHGYLEDVTEARALAQAEHDKHLAEAANRSKTEFLSRMSHELRTPLNAVLGFSQLMAMDEKAALAPDQQRRLGLIRQSGEHLLAMIDDLLDLTSIEAGRLPLTLESVALAPLVDDALAMVQAAAQGHGLLLQRSGGEGLAAWADRKRLRQVMINLLSNAIKYNRPGGAVEVALGRVGGLVRLQVRDTGLGLSADECAHLFEPFNRLGQALGPITGTGIGLTVTRGLVTLMDGAIDVQSTPGEGSCFAVTLPAAPGTAPAPR